MKAGSDAALRRADAEARRAAKTEFAAPLVLEAGAGTGKTAVLVARVVCWCLGPGWEAARARPGAPDAPDGPGAREAVAAAVLGRVAAITFTEAAAAEMTARVGQALEALERGELSTGLADGDLAVPPEERALRAGALRASIDRLEARTIHAFCRRLLAAHPLEAGVAPGFEVDADESRLQALARAVLERALRGAWQEPIDPDYLRLATDGHGPPEIEAALLALVRGGARAADLAADPFGAQVVRTLAGGLGEALAAVLALGPEVLQGVSQGAVNTQLALDGLAATAQMLERPVADRSCLAALCAGLRAIWADDARKKLKNWQDKGANKSERKLLGARAADFDRAIRVFAVDVLALSSLDPELYETARRVLERLLAALEGEFDARGVLSFDDLIRGARRLLEEHPEVAARVRAGIDQLLVDEFQDTDHDQCAILRALALSGARASRPGLFLVGDPKQSIYAWRNADLAAYEGFVTEALNAGGRKLELVVNFRSTPAVLAEVERVFSAPGVMSAVPGVQPAFQRLLPASPASPGRARASEARAGAEYWLSAVPTAERSLDKEESYAAEARALARDVARRHAEEGMAWGEFALLLRSATGVETYLGALRDAGVPYEIRGDRSFFQRREIVDATNLVRAVLDPSDQVALVGLLRSPWVGVPDAALLPLWKQGLPREVARLASSDPERLAELEALVARARAATPRSVPGLAAVAGWPESLAAGLAALARCRESFERDPADVFVEELRACFLPEALEAARHLGGYRRANLARFFRRVVAALDEEGDAQALLRTLRTSVSLRHEEEEGRPRDAAEDALAVLTIHGAKGLDFSHVYVAQLHRRRKPSEDRTVFGRVAGRPEARLLGARSPGYCRLEEQRARVEAAEYVRLLYVASTRARRRLCLLGAWPAELVPKPWDQARSFLELLQARAGAGAALAALLERRTAGGAAHEEASGVLWRWAEEGAAQESLPFGEPRPELAAPERVAADARALAERCARARTRQARPFSARASEEAHAELALALIEPPGSPPGLRARAAPGASGGSGDERGVAAAAGIAVHLVLERFDLARDPEQELERARAGLEPLVAGLVEPSRVPRAVERARRILDRFRASGLLARFAALGPRVLARELPVLLPPGEGQGEPVGFVAGTIDLVYRDEDGALVAVDFKTDAAGPDDLSARVAAYRLQGARYVAALQAALGLERPPRFELWFLQEGTVETVVDASARAG